MILGDDDYLDSNFVESFYDHLDEIMHNELNVVRFAVQLVNDIEINKKSLNIQNCNIVMIICLIKSALHFLNIFFL